MKGRALLLVAIVALASVLAGCSKAKDTPKVLESASQQPKALPMSVSGNSKSVDVTVPDSVPPGPARIDFGNNAQGEHQLQFIRVDKGHKPDEALKATDTWAQGKGPLPEWVHLAGGTPRTEPRVKSLTTQDMQLGTYVVTDTALKGPPQVEATFQVVGDRDHSDPTAKAKIVEYEYGFKATGLQKGRTEVLIQNTGKQPHFVEAEKLKPGKDVSDVKAYLKNRGAGPSPLENGDPEATAVQDGKSAQVTTLEFEQGNYVLLCFVPDRDGGPPHAFKGMVAGVQIR
jgi:hypothetical protein